MSLRPTGDMLQDDSGMSLVELLIAMMLLSIVMASVLGVLFSVQRGVEAEIKLATTVDEARLGFQSFERELRSATAVDEVSSGMGLDVYTMNNFSTRGGRSCTQWRLTGTDLETRWWPYPAPAGEVYAWRTVARFVRNSSPTAGGSAIPIFDVDDSAQFGGRLVNFTLLVNANPRSTANPGGRADSTISTSVAGRNIVSDSANPCNVAGNQPPAS